MTPYRKTVTRVDESRNREGLSDPGATLRVVHLIGQLGYGGTEGQLALLLEHLDASVLESHVVVFNPSPHGVYNRRLERVGVKVWELPSEVQGIGRRGVHLFRLLRRLRPSIVHSWTLHDNPYAGLVGALAGVPVRWGSLRSSLDLAGFARLSLPLRFLSLRAVQHLAVNSRALATELAERRYPARKVSVLPNCVAPPSVSTVSTPRGLEELGIRPSDRLIGTVGNLRRVKNQLLFIQAMARVLASHPDCKAIIVGQALPSEPDLEDRLRAKISELGLEDRVVLSGFRTDVTSLISRLQVFCLTSDNEGMPNTILEAMIAGKPVVATSVGGVPELVEDEVTGFLTPAGDAKELAVAIDRVLADASLAEALGRAGCERALRRHDCRKAASDLSSLYLRAASEKRSR